MSVFQQRSTEYTEKLISGTWHAGIYPKHFNSDIYDFSQPIKTIPSHRCHGNSYCIHLQEV